MKWEPFEEKARRQGFRVIAGLDEAGRGPLAGPVVAAAVVLPPDEEHKGVADSKALTAEKREKALALIEKRALAVGIGIVEAEEIDRLNILQASLKAMDLALQELSLDPDCLLIDGLHTLRCSLAQQAIPKGDGRCLSIAAASIVAKVTRDRLMVSFHEQYPVYNFAKHKGYGTREHLRAIREYGCCPSTANLSGPSTSGPSYDPGSGFSRAKGEQLAVERLKALKYKVLERNFKCPLGEIDIIARDKNTLVFIEVKTRATRDFGGPAAAVHERKQRQLSKVALLYLNQKKLFSVPARFDVVAVELLPAPRIEVIQNAFELCYE